MEGGRCHDCARAACIPFTKRCGPAAYLAVQFNRKEQIFCADPYLWPRRKQSYQNIFIWQFVLRSCMSAARTAQMMLTYHADADHHEAVVLDMNNVVDAIHVSSGATLEMTNITVSP